MQWVCPIDDYLGRKSWCIAVTFIDNSAGSLFIVAIIFGYGNSFPAKPFRSTVISFATKNQVTPEFHMIILRGIGYNWLVCLAYFLGLSRS
ncbi:Formate/nitrite transporter [Penicillium italicum]|uniref:Formate/nitrite transporter n=1 Tax=Penicillium italicum TaxID=40296 RepID=A0A0A2KBM9_PENIT|nr:Formate/nitrite transporter [Penicillium italicum]